MEIKLSSGEPIPLFNIVDEDFSTFIFPDLKIGQVIEFRPSVGTLVVIGYAFERADVGFNTKVFSIYAEANALLSNEVSDFWCGTTHTSGKRKEIIDPRTFPKSIVLKRWSVSYYKLCLIPDKILATIPSVVKFNPYLNLINSNHIKPKNRSRFRLRNLI